VDPVVMPLSTLVAWHTKFVEWPLDKNMFKISITVLMKCQEAQGLQLNSEISALDIDPDPDGQVESSWSGSEEYKDKADDPDADPAGQFTFDDAALAMFEENVYINLVDMLQSTSFHTVQMMKGVQHTVGAKFARNKSRSFEKCYCAAYYLNATHGLKIVIDVPVKVDAPKLGLKVQSKTCG
jgi:hypothetical protein